MLEGSSNESVACEGSPSTNVEKDMENPGKPMKHPWKSCGFLRNMIYMLGFPHLCKRLQLDTFYVISPTNQQHQPSIIDPSHMQL